MNQTPEPEAADSLAPSASAPDVHVSAGPSPDPGPDAGRDLYWAPGAGPAEPFLPRDASRPSPLDAVDLTKRLTREQEASKLAKEQKRLLHLRLIAGGLLADTGRLGPPLCIVFEGWDASGKGGAIKRLVAPLDPRHVRVVSYAAPTYDEKRHHFLSRFWPALPGWGGMAVLDRSWYGRVLVERVEGFATPAQWQRAYGEINAFERTLADEGMVIVKFWMHTSEAEQDRRFIARRDDPLKSWKLTEEDWRNRDKRPAYEVAVADMLERTSTSHAPWTIVAAEDKRYARVKVIKTVNRALEEGLRRNGIDVDDPAAG